MKILRFLFSFEGRFTRLNFLIGFYAAGLASAPLSILALYLHSLPLLLISYVPAFASFVAVATKRLHDRGKSAQWLALYFGPVIVAGAFDDYLHGWVTGSSNSLWALPAFIPAIWGMIELLLLPGTPGPNRFGPGWLTTEPKTFPPASTPAFPDRCQGPG